MGINAIGANCNVKASNLGDVDIPAKSATAFKDEEKPDTFEKKDELKEVKKEASTDKKWGVGIASAVLPGLGQAINGQWGKAAGFFFGGGAATVLLTALCPPLGLLAGLGIGICSIVDAVKSAKASS